MGVMELGFEYLDSPRNSLGSLTLPGWSRKSTRIDKEGPGCGVELTAAAGGCQVPYKCLVIVVLLLPAQSQGQAAPGGLSACELTVQ